MKKVGGEGAGFDPRMRYIGIHEGTSAVMVTAFEGASFVRGVSRRGEGSRCRFEGLAKTSGLLWGMQARPRAAVSLVSSIVLRLRRTSALCRSVTSPAMLTGVVQAGLPRSEHEHDVGRGCRSRSTPLDAHSLKRFARHEAGGPAAESTGGQSG